MCKELSELSLKELWELFPITLTAHRPCWSGWYAGEAAALRQILPETARIHHIGSTAIPSIWAKPIVDILVELPRDMEHARRRMEECGYICMAQGDARCSLNKGYTPRGYAERVFHIHVRYAGDNDELYFRDYLIDHPETAQAYMQLKLQLWKQYPKDRDAYTAHKTAFVAGYTAKAKALYGLRY